MNGAGMNINGGMSGSGGPMDMSPDGTMGMSPTELLAMFNEGGIDVASLLMSPSLDGSDAVGTPTNAFFALNGASPGIVSPGP